MKKVKIALFVIILLLLLVYVVNIDSIPDNIILFQGDKLEMNTKLGLRILSEDEETVPVSTTLEEELTKEVGKIELELRLGFIPIKDITVNVIPKTVVVPGGETIGLKLYTNGVLVVGMSEIQGQDNNKYKPYKNSGIEEGDRIIAVNNEAISSTEDLIKQVNKSNRANGRSKVCKKRNRKNSRFKSN